MCRGALQRVNTPTCHVFDMTCQCTRRIEFGLWLIFGLGTLNCRECIKDLIFSHAWDGHRIVYRSFGQVSPLFFYW